MNPITDLKIKQPRTFTFQPDDDVRLLLTLAEEILHEDRSTLINAACRAALPDRVESRHADHRRRLDSMLAAFKAANPPHPKPNKSRSSRANSGTKQQPAKT